MINLELNSQVNTGSQLNNTYSQTDQCDAPKLPLSKRISSIFKEFVVGMKLAYIHTSKKDIELEALISHNLRLLHKRLLQVPEYTSSLTENNQSIGGHSELWRSLYEDQDVTCGFLTIQVQQDIPCYTHPGINSMYLLISGRAKLEQFALKSSADGTRVNFDIQSSRDLNISDIVFFKSDNTKLTNLSTADKACIFLNIQLSSSKLASGIVIPRT